VGTRLPDDAILTADSGTSAVWLARCIRIRRGMMSSLSGGLATMGCAIPYALAAKLVHPGRPVFAFVGDGAMQMIGFSALIDVAKHWRTVRAAGRVWANRQLVITVLNYRDLNYVAWEQRTMDGDPRYVASQALPDLSYAEFAPSLDFDGVGVEQPNGIADAWDRALASDRPFVIDAVVAVSVPTLPPELEPETEDKLTKALAEDPDAERCWSSCSYRKLGSRTERPGRMSRKKVANPRAARSVSALIRTGERSTTNAVLAAPAARVTLAHSAPRGGARYELGSQGSAPEHNRRPVPGGRRVGRWRHGARVCGNGSHDW